MKTARLFLSPLRRAKSRRDSTLLTVTVQNPYMPATITKTLTVTVNNDGSVPMTLLDGTYGIVGPVCLDAKVKKQPATQSDEAFADRVDAFASTADYTKTYRFVHNDIYSNLHLILLDPAGLVESMTAPDEAVPVMGAEKEKAFTLTFRPDIKTVVPSDGDSLTVKLIATYTNNSGLSKIAYLEIRVEDGTCICPAKKSATEWLNYMCHNLGGLDIISSAQLITYKHHGDWYRFGAKDPSVVNTGTNNGAVDGWINSSTPAFPFYTASGNWPVNEVSGNGLANPCPAGWRLPTIEELATVVNKEINPLVELINYLNVSENLNKFGDYLHLSAPGVRRRTDGQMANNSLGYYWSSTEKDTYEGKVIFLDMSDSPSVGYMQRGDGCSVRCVQAE